MYLITRQYNIVISWMKLKTCDTPSMKPNISTLQLIWDDIFRFHLKSKWNKYILLLHDSKISDQNQNQAQNEELQYAAIYLVSPIAIFYNNKKEKRTTTYLNKICHPIPNSS